MQQWEKLPQFHLLQEKKEKEEGNEYLPLYSLKDVHACLQRIETVSYDEWIVGSLKILSLFSCSIGVGSGLSYTGEIVGL